MKYVSLRVPDDLHTELTEWAARDQRSLHGQILWALQQALAAKRREPRRSASSLSKKLSAIPKDNFANSGEVVPIPPRHPR